MNDSPTPPASDEAGSAEAQDVLRSDPHTSATSGAELFALVYEQLKVLARQRMAAERADHTLQATALVHEAYVRLVAGGPGTWVSETQFFFAAAEAMRRILIDHARARDCLKRGGGRRQIPLNNVLDLTSEEHDASQIMALDDAVSRLEQESAVVASVVRLRFYAGLSVEETARALGVSQRTVKREWTYGRAWLARDLGYEAT
jgi:RNA polymerase sigma factor (TIGR02999 family)